MIQLDNLCKQQKELIEVPNDESRSILGGGILSSLVPPARPLPSPITLLKGVIQTPQNTPFLVPSSITPPTITGGDGRGNVFEVREGGISYENNGIGGGIQFSPGSVQGSVKYSF